jgi:O-antigen/teichoic acid export membrane protein
MPSLLRSIYAILSSRLIGLLIGIVFTLLLVRIVSQDQYGTFASAMAALTIFMLLTRGGLFDSIGCVESPYSDRIHCFTARLVLYITKSSFFNSFGLATHPGAV